MEVAPTTILSDWPLINMVAAIIIQSPAGYDFEMFRTHSQTLTGTVAQIDKWIIPSGPYGVPYHVYCGRAAEIIVFVQSCIGNIFLSNK